MRKQRLRTIKELIQSHLNRKGFRVGAEQCNSRPPSKIRCYCTLTKTPGLKKGFLTPKEGSAN